MACPTAIPGEPKRANGNGGIWRIPPSFDGSSRAPLPRFTALNQKERETLFRFFVEWSKAAVKALRPGSHVFIASNAFLSQLVFSALVEGGLEFRGELIRLVRTFRGGDRPKNAETEFGGVCSLPRSCYEPSFLRQVVRAALPLGEGIIADTFMGSGSTVAAAEALGLSCIGVERYIDYYQMSKTAISQLAALSGIAEEDAQSSFIRTLRENCNTTLLTRGE